MWFGEPHSFPVKGSPTRLSVSGQQSYEGWSCTVDLSKTWRLAVELTQWVRGTPFPGSKVAGAWRWPTNVHMRQTLRMGGAIPLFHPVPGWRVQEQICIVFIVSVVTLMSLIIYRVFPSFHQFFFFFRTLSPVPLATGTNSTPGNSVSVIPPRFLQICTVWTEMSPWAFS